MSEFYRVGIVSRPDEHDMVCATESDAIECARKMSSFNTAVAVWDDRDEPVWIFVLGEQFRRVT